MEYEKLAKELVEMQVENARPLSWIADCIAARGEEQLLLMLAHRDKAVCAGELAECVGLTSGRVANILKQLERKGYIERTPGKQDKRKVLVCLTAAGRELCQAGLSQGSRRLCMAASCAGRSGRARVYAPAQAGREAA